MKNFFVAGLIVFISMGLNAQPLDPTIIHPEQKQITDGTVQSRFIGPVELRVWQHWQASWNVEQQPAPIEFELIRGMDRDQKPYLLLRYKTTESNLDAEFWSETIERTGEWEVTRQTNPPTVVGSRRSGEWTEFLLHDATYFYDINGERVTSSISFAIRRNGLRIKTHKLLPMLVRGPNSAYWTNKVAPYQAHAGTGSITISSLHGAEVGWEFWGDTQIKPLIDYMEANTLTQGSTIGLHRHEQNQEMWMVLSGELAVTHGMAYRNSSNYRRHRVWNDAQELHSTIEFEAAGGWLETRALGPQEMTLIVPNRSHSDTVHFHGARAATCDTIFVVMGERN